MYLVIEYTLPCAFLPIHAELNPLTSFEMMNFVQKPVSRLNSFFKIIN